MPFSVLISRLYDQAGIQYFKLDESASTGSVIAIEKKSDVESPKSEEKKNARV